MTPRPLDRLLRQISETERDEITCAECFELLPGAVEAELGGQPDSVVRARLAQHLGQCGVCREEYEVLRDLVRSDAGHPRAGAGTPPAASGPTR